MAGAGRPGPARGTGGAPRKPASQQAKTGAGYQQVTLGAPGKGKRVYAHRATAYGGMPPKSRVGPKTGLVDHISGQRSGAGNKKANLRITDAKGNSRNRH